MGACKQNLKQEPFNHIWCEPDGCNGSKKCVVVFTWATNAWTADCVCTDLPDEGQNPDDINTELKKRYPQTTPKVNIPDKEAAKKFPKAESKLTTCGKTLVSLGDKDAKGNSPVLVWCKDGKCPKQAGKKPECTVVFDMAGDHVLKVLCMCVAR